MWESIQREKSSDVKLSRRRLQARIQIKKTRTSDGHSMKPQGRVVNYNLHVLFLLALYSLAVAIDSSLSYLYIWTSTLRWPPPKNLKWIQVNKISSAHPIIFSLSLSVPRTKFMATQMLQLVSHESLSMLSCINCSWRQFYAIRALVKHCKKLSVNHIYLALLRYSCLYSTLLKTINILCRNVGNNFWPLAVIKKIIHEAVQDSTFTVVLLSCEYCRTVRGHHCGYGQHIVTIGPFLHIVIPKSFREPFTVKA